MQALGALQASLTPEQRTSLQTHIARVNQSGGNVQGAVQDWLRLNPQAVAAFQLRQQPQQQMAQQQQQQQQQAQQQQAQAQQQAAAAGSAAQQILNHLFPPHLNANGAAGLEHLLGQLYIPTNHGALQPSPILPQVMNLAKGGYMSQQQQRLFAAAIQRGQQRQPQQQPATPQGPTASSPPYQQPLNPALQRAQQAASPPATGSPAAGAGGTGERAQGSQGAGTPAPRMDERLAFQLLKHRIGQLDQLLARTDLSADDRAKAILSQTQAKAQLTQLAARLQAQQQQLQQSRQGTPVQQQQQQFAAGATSGAQQTPQQAAAALGFQRQQNGTPQPATAGTPQQQGQQQRLVNPAQLSNSQPNLAFGGANPQQATSIAPNPTTIAPSALAQTPTATRVGTPAAQSMAVTPSGGNATASTPAASGAPAASTSTAAPAAAAPPPPTARTSTDPRPDAGGRMVTKRKLRDLLAGIDEGDRLTEPAEALLQDVADEFVQSVCAFACRLAKHRGSERLETRDIAFHLERSYGIKVPGFAQLDETRQVPPGPKRGNNPTPYQARLSAIAASEAAAAKRAAR